MTSSPSRRATGPISAIAELSGRRQEEIYRLFKLEGAPTAVGHVGGVLVYDLATTAAWLEEDLTPSDAAASTSVSPNPAQPLGIPDLGV